MRECRRQPWLRAASAGRKGAPLVQIALRVGWSLLLCFISEWLSLYSGVGSCAVPPAPRHSGRTNRCSSVTEPTIPQPRSISTRSASKINQIIALVTAPKHLLVRSRGVRRRLCHARRCFPPKLHSLCPKVSRSSSSFNRICVPQSCTLEFSSLHLQSWDHRSRYGGTLHDFIPRNKAALFVVQVKFLSNEVTEGSPSVAELVKLAKLPLFGSDHLRLKT